MIAAWLPADWRRVTIQGQPMVDAGEHGVMPLAAALILRDLLVTTSKHPGIERALECSQP